MPNSTNHHSGNPPARRFGKYVLNRLLGEGAMGIVYLAHDTKINRPVALKITRFSRGQDARLVERFQREARAAGRLNSPYICAVHDIGNINDEYYIDMEYIEGGTYLQLIEGNSPLDIARVARDFQRLAAALELAHQAGIIHRDIKPSNILLRSDGEPVITDFGLARQSGTDQPRLTQSGELVGSVAYIDPEHVRYLDVPPGPSTDIYSLGVTFYQALTGRPPFVGTSLEILNTFLQPERPEPPAASELRPDIPTELERIVMRMIASNPRDRFATMRDAARAIYIFRSAAGAVHSLTEVEAAQSEEDTQIDFAAAGCEPTAADRLRAALRLATQRRFEEAVDQIRRIRQQELRQETRHLAENLLALRTDIDQLLRECADAFDADDEIKVPLCAIRLLLFDQVKKEHDARLGRNSS